jgi:hypothetical protein
VEQINKRKLTFLFFLLLLLAAATCNKVSGQSKQYKVVAICFNNDCADVKIGSLAITPNRIYITTDGVRTTHTIVHYFKYKGEEHYRLEGKEFDGWLIVNDQSARIELYNVLVKYIFKVYKV